MSENVELEYGHSLNTSIKLGLICTITNRFPTPQGNLADSLNFANSVKDLEIPWNFIKVHKHP